MPGQVFGAPISLTEKSNTLPLAAYVTECTLLAITPDSDHGFSCGLLLMEASNPMHLVVTRSAAVIAFATSRENDLH